MTDSKSLLIGGIVLFVLAGYSEYHRSSYFLEEELIEYEREQIVDRMQELLDSGREVPEKGYDKLEENRERSLDFALRSKPLAPSYSYILWGAGVLCIILHVAGTRY